MVFANILEPANKKRIRSIFAKIRFEGNKKSCEYGAPYRIRVKEFKYFNPKKLFLSSLIRDVHPGSGSATLL
jgi:hypothetical protein